MSKNISLNTTLRNEDKREETNYDDEDDTNPNETMSFNLVIDLKDTFLHDVHSNASNDDVSYEKLQEKYNLMNTKLIDFVDIK